MSERREPGTPGRHMPAMAHICGSDDGYNNRPVCGEPATVHLFAGSPDGGPSDWGMLACDTHAVQAKAIAWDWHPVAAVCDVPGTIWQSNGRQGEGFCFWPEAEDAIHEAVHDIKEVVTT